MTGLKNRPSILVITSLFPTPGGTVFAGSFVVDYLRSLQGSADVTVLVPRELSLRKFFQHRIEQVSVEGLNVYYVGYYSILNTILGMARVGVLNWRKRHMKGMIGRALRAAAAKLHQQQAYTHVHGIELYVGDEAVAIGQALGRPSIVTIHSLYNFLEGLFGQPALKMVLHNLERAGTLVTVSDRARRSYPAKLAERMTVLPNGYTKKAIPALPPTVSNALGQRQVLLFAGFYIPSKHPEFAVRAVADLIAEGYDLALMMVGLGPMENQLQAMVTERHLENNVIFSEPVTPQQLPAYYDRAAIILQPSENESFSMTCLEGMAYGRPCVCTNQAGITEYMTNEREGLVVGANDYQQWLAAVRRLVVDKGLQSRLGDNGVRTAAELTWQHLLPRYLALYTNHQ